MRGTIKKILKEEFYETQLNESFSITEDMDLTGLKFLMLRKPGDIESSHGTTYEITGRCTNPFFADPVRDRHVWEIKWENQSWKTIFSVKDEWLGGGGKILPKKLSTCRPFNSIKKNFEDGVYYPLDLPNSDDLFNQLNESEDDGLEWARDIVGDSPDVPIIGGIYRVRLPKSEKGSTLVPAIIDILITDITEKKVYDTTRAIVIDPDTVDDPDNFIKDYNKSDTTDFKQVLHLIEDGYWYRVPKESSLFKEEDFDPHEEASKYTPYGSRRNDFPGLYEQKEDDFEWVDGLSDEPFHKILMRDNDREPMLMDEIDRIMFNPPVSTEDKRFLDIAYWLEDRDYYPETLEIGKKTSYIEITKQKYLGNGLWRLGPELSEQELYQLSQTPRRGTWNGNFWAEQFVKRFITRK